MSTRAGPAAARGAWAAGLCYFLWGLVPVYWRQLAAVDAVELIAHRLVWTALFTLVVLGFMRGGWGALRGALSSRRALGLQLLSSVLLTANWLVYVWGVNAGHIIETSLGYFLVPLLNVGLGRLVLHERLRRLQWLAIGVAAAGVAWQLVLLGRLPWIALAIAGTFGGYGLLRKQSPLGPLTGLAVESALLAPLGLALLAWRFHTGTGALGGPFALSTQLLVLTTGVVTAGPLLLFAYGAQRIRLSTLGLLQYIAPTVQFSLGLLVYHEPFARERAGSFVLIWTALLLYTVDNVWGQRRTAFSGGAAPLQRA
ncbi:EamA family transporter RarD [Horticoccus luteus]|uniref:EamA family transporter RarD n=1 Tax=Horticoccus luteus TaxID=2862869 RepID=A0A8F9TT87_9BACT|nr:EamA family transporter RarD [Horticoccus luteus]QYM78630.1 EamA family transporter RarD [Horticoccus luteus]